MSSSNSLPSAADQSKTEHEKCCMDEDQDSESEMFVLFGSMFSDEGDFPQGKRTNIEKSEMWLILRKSESDVLDVLVHARLVQTCFINCYNHLSE